MDRDRQAELYGRQPTEDSAGGVSGSAAFVLVCISIVYGAISLLAFTVTESLASVVAIFITLIPSSLTWYLIYTRNHARDAALSDAITQLGWGCFMTLPILICELLVLALFGIVITLFGVTESQLISPGPFLSLVLALAQAFAMAALVEEGFKYIFAKRMVKADSVTSPYTIVIYSAIPALGFASIENLLYTALPMLTEGDVSVGIGTALARFALTVPMHVSTAVYMGTLFARIRFGKEVYRASSILALPIAFHGGYDAALMLTSQASLGTETIVPIEVLILCSIIILVGSIVNARAAVLHLQGEPWYTDSSSEGYGLVDESMDEGSEVV